MKDFIKGRSFEISSEEFKSGEMVRENITSRGDGINKVTERERVTKYVVKTCHWR